jgi:hypothetical protein
MDITFTQSAGSLKDFFSDWRISNYEEAATVGATLQSFATKEGHEEQEHKRSPLIGGRIIDAIHILRE